ncbi:MAG TPA: neutral/alkaline non-lysosomal ceramidase N-terminal domain-containing protein [Pirellulales bacterium]
MKRLAVPLAAIVAIGLLAASTDAAADAAADAVQGWKAGAAKVVITPAAPVWMSGYPRDHPAEGKQQELWAKALVLQDAAGHRALLVTMDLVGIDRPTSQRVCELLAKRYGLERRQIALNVSHTHCGPAIGRNLDGLLLLDEAQQHRVDEYTRQLIDKLVALAGEAIEHLRPCHIAWGQGFSTIAVNRRTNTRQDAARVRELGGLRGPSDFDVPVLTVRDPGGKLQAVVFGYACHPTVLDVEYRWSGDYAGCAQAALEAAHTDAIAMFWAGCGGDQAPRPKGTWEMTEAYGRRLAVSVEEVLAGATRPLEGSLTTIYDEIPLRLDKPPGPDELDKDTASRNKFIAARAKRLLAQLDSGQPLATTYPYPVQLWQLGDVRWIFLGGEVVVDYALRLKRELGPTTWVAGYSNDVMAYIPSLRVLREGGYEGLNSMVYYGLPTRWSEDIEAQIVEQVQKERNQAFFPESIHPISQPGSH